MSVFIFDKDRLNFTPNLLDQNNLILGARMNWSISEILKPFQKLSVVHSRLLIFHVVAEHRNSSKSTKSREIHKNTKNTEKIGRNLIKYMSVQHIWNLFQL